MHADVTLKFPLTLSPSKPPLLSSPLSKLFFFFFLSLVLVFVFVFSSSSSVSAKISQSNPAMVRNDLFITVPSFFKCPISLDVMKSPVSLCTGVTYDRSSIQAWLDSGNNTCPATMQVLHSKDFVPNHTLHRLIQIWSNSVHSNSSSSSFSLSHLQQISQVQATDLVNIIANDTNDLNCLDSLTKIAEFAKISQDNCKFLAEMDGFANLLLTLLAARNIQLSEQVVRILDRILIEFGNRSELTKSMARNRDVLSSFVQIFQKGNLDSKTGSARVLESIAEADPESKILIGETEGMLLELLRMIDCFESETAINAALSCLIAISVPRRIKVRILRLGAVQTLGKALSRFDSSSVSVIEKALKMLEMVSTCTEGRTSICEEDQTMVVTEIVQKMMKVSKVATEHAAVILWSVCYLFRDQRAQEAVMKSNGLTKILLLMQTNCSPSVRHMCSDLIKIFRVNSKSCLSSYDTKTTHIMPF